MQHTFDELREAIHDGQTALVKAFFDFSQTNQERLTQAEQGAASLKERGAMVERRLLDLERKVN